MERLDVEDDEQRQRRIQNHLEKLNSSSSAKIPTTARKFDFGDGTTYPVAPPTELLARVQAFLPQIEASNALLAQQVKTDPLGVNMEHVDDDTGQIIEMNLGLGVFEDRSHRKNTTPKLRDQLDGKDAGRGAGAERLVLRGHGLFFRDYHVPFPSAEAYQASAQTEPRVASRQTYYPSIGCEHK
ncbi:hypothetical protein APHAL10511_005424 [Amanita phalloides]|nr:hypothetical protein APHAL10511_005424 [Amanita phalloides]